MGPTIFSLSFLLSLVFNHAAGLEGDCHPGDLDFALEADGCPALSLLQRRARLTTASSASAIAAKKAVAAPTADIASPPSHAAPPAQEPAVALPRSWDHSALIDMVGPVPLGLLAFNTDFGATDKTKRTNLMTGPGILVLIIPGVILAAGILFCLMTDRFWETPEDDWKGGKLAGEAPAGAAGSLLTQSSLASTSSSIGTPYTMAMSPVSPTARKPVQQMSKTPACLLFPTMAADVRFRSRAFEVFWGSFDAPWFRLTVRPGDTGFDVLELSEVHDGISKLAATVNLHTNEFACIDGQSPFMITNKSLRANTRGLAYRSAKDHRKVQNAVASWGSIVYGVKEGDWLKVGDWYLPIVVDGFTAIVEASANDAPQVTGLQIMRADGIPFATFKPVNSGRYHVIRNGAVACQVAVGTNSFLVEATLPNGKRVATVQREQVRMPNDEQIMMLELVVEPQVDPVIMLLGCIAILRQLPAHQE